MLLGGPDNHAGGLGKGDVEEIRDGVRVDGPARNRPQGKGSRGVPGAPWLKNRRDRQGLWLNLGEFASIFAHRVPWLVDEAYPDAPVVQVVLDNLGTHGKAPLYEAFPPKDARSI